MVLCALSAKYIHKTLAPWCLKSYCDTQGAWEIEIFEASINDDLSRVSREIFLRGPDVIGLSCYIWNIDDTLHLAAMVKKMLPESTIVFGGPEVSFGGQYPQADYVIQGPGELALAQLLHQLERGEKPQSNLISPTADPYPQLPTPYTGAYFASFGEGGIGKQLVYYESSRGCPFSCTYCLSSAMEGVSDKPLDVVFNELGQLLAHGARVIKFVDRTFNANRQRAAEILSWVQALDTDCTFHFEAGADLFDERLMALLAAMPQKRVQLELGIQSVHHETLKAIRREADTELCLDTIRRLCAMGNSHIHVDLIAGLPHETMETFAQGVNACIAAAPHMLQLGFLKVLRGTCMRQTCDLWGTIYHDDAPYEVVSTATMSAHDLIVLKGIEEVIDKFYNSGKYPASLAYAYTLFPTPYHCFDALALACRGKNITISLKKSYTILLDFLTTHGQAEQAAHCIRLDCLTFDSKGQLPDALPPLRDKGVERACREKGQRRIRAERFPDGIVRLFDYDDIDPITRACRVSTWHL